MIKYAPDKLQEIQNIAEPSPFSLQSNTDGRGDMDFGSFVTGFLLNELNNLFQNQKINDEKHYFITDLDSSVNVASPKKYLFVTPNSVVRIHANFGLQSDTAGTLCLYEDPTTTSNGAALSIFNSDRNSSNISVLTSFVDPTTTDDGTKLSDLVIGQRAESAGVGKADAGAPFMFEHKIILKQDTKYLLSFTPTDDGARVSLDVSFFENGD